jgi:hypothetical protein
LVQPPGAGELVGVAAAFDGERDVDEVDRDAAAHPQPQVVVLAGRQTLVEKAHPVEQLAAHHHRRGAHEAQIERRLEDHPAALAVPFPRVHPPAVAHPGLFGLGDQGFRVRAEEFDLG